MLSSYQLNCNANTCLQPVRRNYSQRIDSIGDRLEEPAGKQRNFSLDSTTAILVIAPIIAKPLVMAGVDPVHLDTVVVFNLMIGLLTPPMGLALFLVADIAKVSMREVLKEMIPYYLPLAITLLLITYVPALTTWLPRLAMGGQ